MKVSIIVPVYNIQDYVKKCVHSLTSQSYKDLEIILIDDGSKDGSGKICDGLSLSDERIKVIHKPNGGLSSARNAGIDAATGDFLMFVDGDDTLALNAVELVMGVQREYGSDIVQFDFYETTSHEDRIDKEAVDAKVVSNTKEMFEKLYEIGGAAASACTKLYKRSVFDSLRFKEGILHEDEQLIPYVLQTVGSIAYINNRLYCYFMREGSIVKSGFNEKKLVIFDIMKERMEILSRLGFTSVMEKERDRSFTRFVIIFTDAKRAGSKVSCKKIKALAKDFLRHHKANVSGTMGIIYRLCRVNIGFISAYYYLRKLLGKENA